MLPSSIAIKKNFYLSLTIDQIFYRDESSFKLERETDQIHLVSKIFNLKSI